MTSKPGRRIIGVSVNNNATTHKIMTITTDAANETTKTAFELEHALFQSWGIGMVQDNLFNDGAQVFLGIQGEHGTTIRTKDAKEREALAILLELMVEKLRQPTK